MSWSSPCVLGLWWLWEMRMPGIDRVRTGRRVQVGGHHQPRAALEDQVVDAISVSFQGPCDAHLRAREGPRGACPATHGGPGFGRRAVAPSRRGSSRHSRPRSRARRRPAFEPGRRARASRRRLRRRPVRRENPGVQLAEPRREAAFHGLLAGDQTSGPAQWKSRHHRTQEKRQGWSSGFHRFFFSRSQPVGSARSSLPGRGRTVPRLPPGLLH